MALISKNEKNLLWKSAFLFKCRLLTANLTKHSTWPWMFLFDFAVEIYRPFFQITRSVAQYGFKNWLYWSCLNITVTFVLLYTFSLLIYSWFTLVSNCFSCTLRSKYIITLHVLSRLTKSFNLSLNQNLKNK